MAKAEKGSETTSGDSLSKGRLDVVVFIGMCLCGEERTLIRTGERGHREDSLGGLLKMQEVSVDNDVIVHGGKHG